MVLQNFHFHAELIPGQHAAAKAHLVETGQHEQGTRFGANLIEGENRAGLRQRLDDQHPGHHRKIGKMTAEEWLVEGDVFDGEHVRSIELQDAIDQQERIAMRQGAQDSAEFVRLKAAAAHVVTTSRWSISWPPRSRTGWTVPIPARKPRESSSRSAPTPSARHPEGRASRSSHASCCNCG